MDTSKKIQTTSRMTDRGIEISGTTPKGSITVTLNMQLNRPMDERSDPEELRQVLYVLLELAETVQKTNQAYGFGT